MSKRRYIRRRRRTTTASIRRRSAAGWLSPQFLPLPPHFQAGEVRGRVGKRLDPARSGSVLAGKPRAERPPQSKAEREARGEAHPQRPGFRAAATVAAALRPAGRCPEAASARGCSFTRVVFKARPAVSAAAPAPAAKMQVARLGQGLARRKRLRQRPGRNRPRGLTREARAGPFPPLASSEPPSVASRASRSLSLLRRSRERRRDCGRRLPGPTRGGAQEPEAGRRRRPKLTRRPSWVRSSAEGGEAPGSGTARAGRSRERGRGVGTASSDREKRRGGERQREGRLD